MKFARNGGGHTWLLGIKFLTFRRSSSICPSNLVALMNTGVVWLGRLLDREGLPFGRILKASEIVGMSSSARNSCIS